LVSAGLTLGLLSLPYIITTTEEALKRVPFSIREGTLAVVTQIRKRIGMVFQKANPFPKTIYENIAYGLRINNFERSKIKYTVERALRESYLWEEVKDELKKPAIQLSGGQQQRLCIESYSASPRSNFNG